MEDYQLSLSEEELKFEILDNLRRWHFELHSNERDSGYLEMAGSYLKELRKLGCTEKIDLDESEIEEIKRICEIKNKWKEEYIEYWATRGW